MASATATLSDITIAQRRTLIAAALGWMLDAFDVMLYSMVVAALIQDPQLHLSLQIWQCRTSYRPIRTCVQRESVDVL